MYEVKDYFRGTTEGYNVVSFIDPLKDIDKKIKYFFIYLLLPLLFLPLIYWKIGILAMPAIGVNLISGYETMYTSHYHYDDVSSTLLILSFILTLKHIDMKKVFQYLSRSKLVQFGTVLCLTLILYNLPYSNIRLIKKVVPTSMHFKIINEINEIDDITKNVHIAVQDVLGPHFYRKKIQAYYQGEDCSYDNNFYKGVLPYPLLDYDYIILSSHVSKYGLMDYKKCIFELENSGAFMKLNNYKYLDVYKRKI